MAFAVAASVVDAAPGRLLYWLLEPPLCATEFETQAPSSAMAVKRAYILIKTRR